MVQNNFIITQSAVNRLNHLISLEHEKENTALRITVEGGGCAGFQYKYHIGPLNQTQQDILIVQNDVKVVIDNISMQYLKGATLNFVHNLGGEYFEIQNPNAASGCGCGNSFSI